MKTTTEQLAQSCPAEPHNVPDGSPTAALLIMALWAVAMLAVVAKHVNK
jgi:hypothetical protein